MIRLVGRRLAAVLAFGLLATAGALGVAAQAPPVVRVAASSNDGANVIYIAKDRGFFERAGLDVQIEPDTNGAAAAAAVVAGSVDVAVSNVLSIATAHLKGLPLGLIAPSALYLSKAPINQLLVLRSSPIQSGSDLDGKTVAIDGLGNVTQVAAEAWIDAHGGNSKSVHYIELPFAEMGAALERHAVDAAEIAEPALSIAKAHGEVRVLGNPLSAIASRFLITGWFANTHWVAAHPDIVRRFVLAIHDAAIWANAHQDLTAPILASHTRLTPAVIAHMTRAVYADSLEPGLIEPQIDAAYRYGVLQHALPARDLIASAEQK